MEFFVSSADVHGVLVQGRLPGVMKIYNILIDWPIFDCCGWCCNIINYII